jgi:16S rRNA (adenine1518-N6/adenine1519-N6)-dimethyltransferase
VSSRARILTLMQQLGIEPKKSLGQNFLISEHVIEKIIDAVKSLEPKSIIEIGPGLGSLTVGLMNLKKPLLLMELDSVLVKYWLQEGCSVIEGDALQIDWQKNSSMNDVLVSNLPYQISASIVVDRSIDEHQLAAMVLMFQKEVAQRIRAGKDQENYGFLSVIAQTFWQIETVLEAGTQDFFPAPKVASRVLLFKKRNSRVINKKQFLKFTKSCFLHPRKYMASNLVEGISQPREKILEAFVQAKISEKTRAQQLSVEQFLDLYSLLGYR